MVISIKYYLRNFLLTTLHQRSLGPCRKRMRLLDHCRKLRLLRPCRKQMRSFGPCSRGVTFSRGVSLVITILYYSPIDLSLLMKNRQALTSKSFLIQEDTSIRKGLPQGISTRKIQSRFQLSIQKTRLSLFKLLLIYIIW